MSVSKINAEVYNDSERYCYLKSKSHKVRVEKALKIIQDFSNKNKAEMNILDIGCGSGEISERFFDIGLKVYGLDFAEKQLKIARQKGVITAHGDVQDVFPFEDKQFDIVFCGEIIEHLVDVRPFILEINRVMKTNALLVITTPNLAGLNDRLRFLFGYNPRHTAPLSLQHFLHIRPFTYNTLKDLLEKTAFEIQEFKSNKVRFNVFQGKDIDSYFLANLFPKLGASLIFGVIKKQDIKNIEQYSV